MPYTSFPREDFNICSCYRQCLTPDKIEKSFPRHLNHSRLITPTRSHLILQRLQKKKKEMKFNAANCSKPNETKKYQRSQTPALGSTALSAAVRSQARESRLPWNHLMQVPKTMQLVLSLLPKKQTVINCPEIPSKTLI